MREIKFRCWDDGEMIYEKNIQYLMKEEGIKRLFIFFRTIRNDGILMQYTGLKDKNGKEIYEGDIIKGVFYMYDCQDTVVETHFVNGEVIFDTGMFTCEDADFDLYLYDIEVIGNKYENKE